MGREETIIVTYSCFYCGRHMYKKILSDRIMDVMFPLCSCGREMGFKSWKPEGCFPIQDERLCDGRVFCNKFGHLMAG